MKRVLVFSPHPDDDAFGCGGSIAKHVEQGNKVSVVYLTSGEAGGLGYSTARLAKIRKREAQRAAKIFGLGENDLRFLGEPDGYLEVNKRTLAFVTSLIREMKPQIVYAPHSMDAHYDHRKAHEMVSEAVGRAGARCFPECDGEPWTIESILYYEVWTPLSAPNHIEDITRFVDRKARALREHKTQAHLRLEHAAMGLNAYRGGMSHQHYLYAEAFHALAISK